MIRRYGRYEGLISWVGPGLFYLSLAISIGYSLWPYFYFVKNGTLITIGLFATWRYSWQVLHYLRALRYGLFVYPAIRRRVERAVADNRFPRHVYFIIPSYNEEPWVSTETFFSIMSEVGALPCGATLVVSTGSDQDDSVIAATHQAHPARYKVDLILQRQAHGKRIAMGHALRAVARHYNLHNFDDTASVTIFMDGDSYLEPDILKKTVPLFAIFPRLGAATTNELAYIRTRSRWYKDWFNLKFGQRHILFQSHSLSRKVLTLTGRFSLFRTSIVVEEDFIRRIENDILRHPFHGKFRFLMGDDKSSWFEVLRRGWDMLYVPDATCYSLESRNADFLSLSTSLPYRWYGNTLRNNGRALALGWRRIGFFIWLCILDQRLSMWTSLVGITGAIILALFRDLVYFPIFIAWVLIVRSVQMFVIAWNGHTVSLLTIPLMLYNQWVGAVIKIRAFFFLADQKWSKGGVSQDAGGNVVPVPATLARWMPRYLMLLSYSVFICTLLFSEQVLMLPDVQAEMAVAAPATFRQEIDARAYGVVPDDGMDDAAALNRLFVSAAEGAVIRLPPGVLDIHAPLVVNRSSLTIAGQGRGRTILRARLTTPAMAVLRVEGIRGSRVATLDEDTRPGQSLLDQQLPGIADSERMALLIRQPNDQEFCRAIGSRQWCRQYPYLRQTMVFFHRRQGNLLALDRELFLSFARRKAEIFVPRLVRDVVVRDLSIRLDVKGHGIGEVRFVYENLFPEHQVDLLRFQWAADCRVENVALLQAGRHALVFEDALACSGRDLLVDGAWNKGGGGSGYVRFARAYGCVLQNSVVRNIRHITLQWSAAWNLLQGLETGVDINIHGGYPHHNLIRDITFRVPPEHRWGPVTEVPDDASWAPPNGPGNVIEAIRTVP